MPCVQPDHTSSRPATANCAACHRPPSPTCLQVFSWAPNPPLPGLPGVQASERPPLETFLQSARLEPQLAAYLKD